MKRQFKVEPYSFQKEGVDFLSLTNGTSLLSDDMGCGKSIQSLFWCNKNNKRALIVCPASIQYNWRNEIKKFTYSKSKIINSKSVKTKKYAINYNDSNLHYLIISYSYLKHFVLHEKKGSRNYYTPKNTLLEIQRLGFDTVIFDEAHYTGNQSSIRSKMSMLVAKKMKHRIFLTGTPIKNKPIEFFPMLNILMPEEFNNWKHFGIKYCGLAKGRFGNVFTSKTNLQELYTKIKPIFLRRKKEEVLDQLPDKTRQIIFHELGSHPEYNRIIEEILEAENDFSRLRGLNNMRMVLAQAMMKETMKYAMELIENTESKIIVGSMFKRTLDMMMENKELDKYCLYYNGELSAEQKNDVLNEFNTNPSKRIIAGTIQSMGVGLNIQVADKVVFNDCPWTPADAFQFEDRAYRNGQKNNVNVYYMGYKDTYYEVMFDIINNKNALIETVLEGDEVTKGNVLEQVIQFLKKQTA